MTLTLTFNTRDEYTRAKDFYNDISDFWPERDSDEFRTFFFEEDNNPDQLERDIDQELTEMGFTGYYFATE